MVLILSTAMLVTIGTNQSSIFAQNSTSTPTQNSAPITPAPQPSGGDDDESSNGNNNDESSNSSGSDNDADDSSSGDGSDTSSSEDEDDLDQTNPLLEQIRNRVYGALSSDGIPVP
jgi:hypothetical protein